MLAQAIHNNSRRSGKPFVKLNLTALSEAQVMEELLPEDGREGILKRAEGGTLYLNGIHCMSIPMQKELLNVIDQMPDVRFIASTEADLYAMCQEGRFLKALFYLVGEVSLETLPIRQRPEDIPLLFEYFIRNIYNNSALRWNDMCSEELWSSLPLRGKADHPGASGLHTSPDGETGFVAFPAGKTDLTGGGPESEDRAGRPAGDSGERRDPGGRGKDPESFTGAFREGTHKGEPYQRRL